MKLKFIFALLLCCSFLQGQTLNKDKQYYVAAIGFWNVENLYDTLNDPKKIDEEFLPEGLNAWTGSRYWTKIDHLARVISEMGSDATPEGLSIIGLCEIENKNCLDDLVKDPKLKARNYQTILVEGPDARGVDPGLLYNPKHFKVTNVVTYGVVLPTDSGHKTRDQLVVSGSFFGEPLTVIVNHWPSRRGGELASRPNRIAAAKICRRIADSVSKLDPKNKVIIMGDLNDDPPNESVKKGLKTCSKIEDASSDIFFNPMAALYKQGIGTLAWQDSWNLFDQTIMNQPLIPSGYKTFQYYKAFVFNKAYLKSDFGNFKGYPFRTYSGGTYTAGFSDHFPVYVLLVKERS
jgi:hypothetical protein